MADSELAKKLQRRNQLNEVDENGEPAPAIQPKRVVVNVYTDFPEFSRKEIQQYEKTFKK